MGKRNTEANKQREDDNTDDEENSFILELKKKKIGSVLKLR